MEAANRLKSAEAELREVFAAIDRCAYINQTKVLEAFRSVRVRDTHFNQSSGYGYGDIGRDDLERLYSQVFKAEDALVRGQIVSGTHAISACLTGILRPGDRLVSAVGAPYDTLRHVIGVSGEQKGSLLDRGVLYEQASLNEAGGIDYDELEKVLADVPRMVLIQRSRGYTWRPALNIKEIEEVIVFIRQRCPQTIVFVDNCYGEFTEEREPLEAGADLIAGSLIKNPGGGLGLSGGYVAGRADLVETVASHLTAPGLGKELGASLANPRLFYQGFFLAPHVVAQALKGAALLAQIMTEAGYQVSPGAADARSDIVQAVRLRSAEEIKRFCQIVQTSSPVDSDVQLEYALLPGYDVPVIMAAGTFVQGASIEMSCDAPLKEPYNVYFQGGLTYEHVRYAAGRVITEFLMDRS